MNNTLAQKSGGDLVLIKILLEIGALFAVAIVALLFTQAKHNADIAQAWRTLQTRASSIERFSKEMIADQPEPVQRYFLHAFEDTAPEIPIASSVHLKMSGTLRLAPTQEWMPLQAEELLSTQGFVWKATAGKGLMQMQGADYYMHGAGRSRFSLWGLIPVVNAQSPDVMRSSIGRWMGECFWLPTALLPSRGVSWRAIDANTIQASLKADGELLRLTFVIDAQGRLLRSSFLRWGNQTEDKHYAEIPFGATYEAEQTFDGYTIPSQISAGWWSGTDRYFEFFRMTLEQAEFR
ncbi:hypothetical protein NC981_19385 [Leptolyngbya sp. DQ-M1]|uniref:DUF6920 family protein n=1 Tax=Leptolyngbya sp. DQ-M1 TaxID=2933920 RepID=UPI003298EF76